MSFPHLTGHRITSAVAAACVGLTLASAAGAVDLRSWDMKINDVTKRFIVLPAFGGEAVLDKETQLVWQRTPDPNFVSIQHAATEKCMQNKTGGRAGWRLPSFHELASLTNPSAAPNSLALPVGHPFLAVPKGRYWSATQDRKYPTYVYQVHLNFGGYVSAYPQDNSQAYFWCVRGGGPISEY
jgi:hypothetical protein